MATYYPLYQKKIDYETGEDVLDSNGCFIMEHISDLIVRISDTPVYRDPTPEEIEEIRLFNLQSETLISDIMPIAE